MKSILRALVMTGILGLGAAGAQAQTRVFVGFGAPVVAAAVPRCGVRLDPGLLLRRGLRPQAAGSIADTIAIVWWCRASSAMPIAISVMTATIATGAMTAGKTTG